MDLSDEQIMQDYRDKGPQALEVIFERYKMRIFNFCLRLLGNRAEAEDVTSEVFLKLFSGAYTPAPEAKFSTWLFTVARNQSISQIRKRTNIMSLWFRKKMNNEEGHWDIEDNAQTSAESLTKGEERHIVRKAVHKLPLEQKEAIILREYFQMPYDEIAQVLGCSLEKVKVLIFRAREHLKGELHSLIKEGE